MFWSESLKEKDRSEDLGVDENILECILEKLGGGGELLIGFVWLRNGTGDSLL
jgi:hypothetical protein